MTRRIQLPRELADRPFHIREGAEHGLSGKLLRGPKVERPFPGIRVPRGLVVAPWRSFAPALRPGQRFSHLTAAIIRGAPVPRPLRDQVHVSSPGSTPVRVTGTRGHTHTRCMTARAGIPEPTPGFEVRRGNGTAIGWFDLCWEEWRIAAEYDGDRHRTSTEQYEKDIRRFDEATAAGWIIIRVRKAGLYQRPWETLDRIRGAFATRGIPL